MRLVNSLVGALAIAAVLLGFSTSQAAALPQPTGKPILEITGAITVHNGGGIARFDRVMLEALGTKVIVTTTPWHKGSVRFEGVPLATLMKAVGAQGSAVKVTALNDYVSVVPMADFARHGVILALKADGSYMEVKDRGPLFIIYPYDADPTLKSQRYYARSVWQVRHIEVRK